MPEAMTEPAILHNTFVIERSYPVPPERLFRAFSNPDEKRRWYVQSSGNEIENYSLDFRPGGDEITRYRMAPGTPIAGAILSTRANYQVIDPDKCIIMAQTMSLNDKCISTALITLEFQPTATGTDLICTHQAGYFENSGGPEMRQAGWETLFNRLATALEDAAA